MCRERSWLLLFGWVCLLWSLRCCGGSTVNKLREEELRVVVAFSVVFVLVVSLSRTCCVVVRSWLGCRSRGDRGRGSCWLFESAAYEVTFHSIPSRAVSSRSEPSHVAREIVVVPVVWEGCVSPGAILLVERVRIGFLAPQSRPHGSWSSGQRTSGSERESRSTRERERGRRQNKETTNAQTYIFLCRHVVRHLEPQCVVCTRMKVSRKKYRVRVFCPHSPSVTVDDYQLKTKPTVTKERSEQIF